MNEREVSDHKLDADLRASIAIGYTRYVPAPMLLMGAIEGVITHGEILGVWIYPDEEVEWLWNADNRVYGYGIVRLRKT